MMKAKKMYLIVFLIALIALTPCFSACKKKEQETIKKDSALVKNAYEIYKEDDSKLQVKPQGVKISIEGINYDEESTTDAATAVKTILLTAEGLNPKTESGKVELEKLVSCFTEISDDTYSTDEYQYLYEKIFGKTITVSLNNERRAELDNLAKEAENLIENRQGKSDRVLIHQNTGTITWKVDVPETGFYNLQLDYFTISGYSSSIERKLLINGEIPFDGADSFTFSRIWKDDVDSFDENGNFDGDETHKILSERLENTERAVIPGFYGAKPDGSIQTFSRGGSDITGSIVAKAVHADMYENWTDVSGFLIADPRIIKNPKPIDVITYRELRELSYMGATVLHEDAIFPVRKEGIPINIRNTNAPEEKGTLIVEGTCRKPKYTITGIGGKRGFASITIEKAMMNSEVGFGRKVLGVFEDEGISFEHMPSGIDTMTIFVHQDEFEEHEQKVLAGIHRAVNPDDIELESDLALIAVVGRGMRQTRGTAGRIFSALAHAHVNVKMIDQGSSELNIIIGVENRDFETAVKAIYDIFVLTQM